MFNKNRRRERMVHGLPSSSMAIPLAIASVSHIIEGFRRMLEDKLEWARRKTLC